MTHSELNLMQQARQLRDVAERLELFLQQQGRRLETSLVPGGDVPHDPKTLKQLMAEFERMRKEWEEQRAQELERIQLDSARLADAWTKLEAEQRRILGERQALQLGASGAILPRSVVAACMGNSGSTTAARVGGAEIPSRPGQTSLPAGRSTDPREQSTCPEPAAEHRPPSLTELSMLEFQQLKREIQKHRK